MRSAVEGTDSVSAPCRGWRSRFALVSRRARRSASAWALPRPSAIASAKLANSTVNQSQTEIAPMKLAGASPWPRSACTNRPVVSTLPTSTTNMTGLRTIKRGSSFRNESTGARWYIAPRCVVCFWMGCF